MRTRRRRGTKKMWAKDIKNAKKKVSGTEKGSVNLEGSRPDSS